MKFLIVEDDLNTATIVKDSLMAYSHTVEISGNGTDALFLAKSYEYDAILLDNSLPGKDGLSICRDIRSAGKTTPILFMSVDDETDTKVQAFKNGADDYMTKPFALEEMRARIDAVTRRTAVVNQSALSILDLSVDLNDHTVIRAGRIIHLTRKEFHMLEYFMRHVGKILSRAQLMEHVWTADGNPFSNTVEAHISNLRNKLNAGRKANLIANVPGQGYVLDAPERLARMTRDRARSASY
jgi:two-component system OmpR family response regulator